MGLFYLDQLNMLPEEMRLWHARNIYEYRVSDGASHEDALKFVLSLSGTCGRGEA
ncbi:hypothetical protein AGMMS50276_28570 [Synergistales bacterium]|nr:hypothetical protein AGMMS50276_28570 [Synergistales bacterium]